MNTMALKIREWSKKMENKNIARYFAREPTRVMSMALFESICRAIERKAGLPSQPEGTRPRGWEQLTLLDFIALQQRFGIANHWVMKWGIG